MTDALRLSALRLLAQRDYSRAGLRAKLAAKAESEEALAQVLDRLQEEHLLSDARYAGQRVVARASRYGDARLRQDLQRQGLSDELIRSAVEEAGDEVGRCRAVWEKKFSALPDTPTEHARQVRFLMYRGFSGEAVRSVLRAARSGDER